MATKPTLEAVLHNDLLVKAIDYLEDDCNKGKNKAKFTEKLRGRYFTDPAKEAILNEKISNIFMEMKRLGILDVGEYDVLLEVTEGIDHGFTKLIKETMEKINKQRGAIGQSRESVSNNRKLKVHSK